MNPPRAARARAPHGVASQGLPLAEALQQAITLVRDEQLEDADAALRGILRRWPGEPNALHFTGVLRHAQGRADDAAALIRQSLAAAPDNAGAWNNLGNVLLSAGRVEEAVQAYEHGVAASPGGLGTAAAEGLQLFLDYAAELGVAPSRRALEYF